MYKSKSSLVYFVLTLLFFTSVSLYMPVGVQAAELKEALAQSSNEPALPPVERFAPLFVPKGAYTTQAVIPVPNDLRVTVNKGCGSTYQSGERLQLHVGAPAAGRLTIYSSTNGAWWQTFQGPKWVQMGDRITANTGIQPPVGNELVYAQLVTADGQLFEGYCYFFSKQFSALSELVASIVNVGWPSAPGFQVKAYNPAVGTSDGAGIAYVIFKIYDPHGRLVHSVRENYSAYCAFTGDAPCQSWSFANNHYRWSSGYAVQNGTHQLVATAYAKNSHSKTVETSFSVRVDR